MGYFKGFPSNSEWATVVYGRRSRCGMGVYCYISLSIFFFASILCLSVCMSVCLCVSMKVSWWLKLWLIIYYDTFKFDSKNQFKVSQLQIYTIQNYKTTDLKIILTVRPFMQSHKKSNMYCTTVIFRKICFFLVLELLLNVI